MLRDTEVPLHYFGPSADTAFTVSQPDAATTVWKVTSDGSPVLRYTAVTEPVADHKTRVILSIEGETSSRFGDTAARMKRHPAIRALYLATMTEATDSTLEARPFDATRFYPQIGAAAMASIGQLKPPSPASGSH